MENIDKLIQMLSDQYHLGIQRTIDLLVGETSIYQYLFTYRGSSSLSILSGLNSTEYGAAHADDLIYMFNPHLEELEFPMMRSETDRQVRDYMVKLWTNFAKSGYPSTPGEFGFHWTELNKADPKYLKIDRIPSMTHDFDKLNRLGFWDKMFPLESVDNVDVDFSAKEGT